MAKEISTEYEESTFAQYCEQLSATIAGQRTLSIFEAKDVNRSLKTISEGARKEQFFDSPLFISLVKSVFELSSELADSIRGPAVYSPSFLNHSRRRTSS